MKTIGFLGAGNMAEALIRGLLRGHFEAGQITASGPRQERMDELHERFGIHATTDNRQPAAADIVILSVKPQMLNRLLLEVGDLIRP
ncbi:MAG TPA: NAD(P)-binding domain-containing protein, partial [Thermoanaerobaculia bacterium]|nr:NAD(P)-binding domain-containing protein [Thermoanaerobaculia bacterium]